MPKKDKQSLKTPKPAILFSFDGAVMNTEAATLATYRHVFAVYGTGNELTKENIPEVCRMNPKEVLATYLPDADQTKAYQEFAFYQANHLIDLIQPMPGILDLLIYLKQNNYPTGIVSARNRSDIVELLRHSDITQYFDVIIGSSGYLEERSDAILKACHLLNAKSCVFITDSSTNVISAIADGCFTIGIVSHPTRTKALSEAGAGFLTKDYRQIMKLLEGEPLWLAYELNYDDATLQALKKKAKADKKARKEAKRLAKSLLRPTTELKDEQVEKKPKQTNKNDKLTIKQDKPTTTKRGRGRPKKEQTK